MNGIGAISATVARPAQAPSRLGADRPDRRQELSESELKVVAELKARDREVRAHEQAHKNVGGQYAGAISYEYQTGPDNVRYAVGGEVPIDVAPVPGDPEATIAKMAIVRAAALAPSNPSAQDRKVAQQADANRISAEAELRSSRAEEAYGAARPDDEKSNIEQFRQALLEDNRPPFGINEDPRRLNLAEQFGAPRAQNPYAAVEHYGERAVGVIFMRFA